MLNAPLVADLRSAPRDGDDWESTLAIVQSWGIFLFRAENIPSFGWERRGQYNVDDADFVGILVLRTQVPYGNPIQLVCPPCLCFSASTFNRMRASAS